MGATWLPLAFGASLTPSPLTADGGATTTYRRDDPEQQPFVRRHRCAFSHVSRRQGCGVYERFVREDRTLRVAIKRKSVVHAQVLLGHRRQMLKLIPPRCLLRASILSGGGGGTRGGRVCCRLADGSVAPVASRESDSARLPSLSNRRTTAAPLSSLLLWSMIRMRVLSVTVVVSIVWGVCSHPISGVF